MKRWQDRGEVQDSDDEELSLRAESQSPERPTKRARLEDAGAEIANQSLGRGNEARDEAEDDIEDWLQPTPAITYGRKTGTAAATGIEGREPLPDDATTETATIDATPVKPAVQTQSDMSNHLPSSQSSGFGDLPDVQDILAGRTNTLGVRQVECQVTSTSSSPLTERDISPSPPPDFNGFHFSRVPPAAGRPILLHSVLSDEEGVTRSTRSEASSPAIQRRRNLRTRNEKQLHPYMFDKAQYQQQCRERGMRPVRVMEAEQHAAETQDDLGSGDGSQSSRIIYGNNSSSPARQSPIVRPSSQPRSGLDQFGNERFSSDDDLPDLRPSQIRSIPHEIQQGSKRRRLFSTTRKSATDSRTNESEHELDELSVPPSPPPTSSDHRVHLRPVAGQPRFRVPRGLTPLPLATPQVSSDARRLRDEDETGTSETELPSRRFGSPTASRMRPQHVPISSSSEASEAEDEQNWDERRLHREKRRIKGVLPASWLKIDFRAQRQPPPPRVRRASASSPERISPQKGVAQRIVSKKHSTFSRPTVIAISDDESNVTSDDQHAPPSPRMNQSRLQFDSGQRRTSRPEFIDLDEMEVDWVDPMFTASSSKRKSRSSKKHQPKIAEAFGASISYREDFSEERRGLSHRIGNIQSRDRPAKKIRKPKPQRSMAPRLSILDAPTQDSGSPSIQPQFVRIAMRQARIRSDKARQSPSHKQIRLATRADTRDASVVLRAWREGTFVPRQIASDFDETSIPPVSNKRSNRLYDTERQTRVPLAELSRNPQQRHPSPFRKEPKQLNISRLTVSTQRKPSLQQTRIHPELLVREQSPQAHERPEMTARPAPKPRLNRIQPMHAAYRGAQLESLESEFDQSHRAAAFERRMQLLTENVARRGKNAATDHLDRFLYGSGATVSILPEATNTYVGMRKNHELPGPKEALPRHIRKRPPRRVDAETREYRQPSEPLPDTIDADQLPDIPPNHFGAVFQGLGPVGTRYATDFDMLPLSVGTYFHQSSFIGSGDFAAALKFANRDLDKTTGRITIHVEGEVLEWGAWTEDVAAGLDRVPRAISSALQTLQTMQDCASNDTSSLVMSNVDYLLRSTTRYFSRCLAFLDPVDRNPCIERIQRFVEDIFEVMDEGASIVQLADNIAIRCLQYALVIAKQALTLCYHRPVDTDTTIQCRNLVERAAHRLIAKVFARCLPELRSFYDENWHASAREGGIRDDNVAVTSLVLLHHVLDEPEVQSSSFWTVIYQHLNVNEATIVSAPQLDKVWYDIFTLLPVLEIDAYGIARVGARLHGSQEGWSLVKRLLERLLSFYDATCASHGLTINDYVRATFTRCYRLVTRWGWWRCESILGTMFDFFARRGLAQLHREESRGSPRFLEELKDIPTLEVQAEERSFNIFLKTLASGLIGMQQHQRYTAKKISGIAWRFIPNHGRTYRKDAEIQQSDLDALRNHHDLLCTLYYAAPSTHRLRVDLIRHLVDHSASHREACRLSVRAWANLAAFQISTDEGVEQLEPFTSWYREMMTITISQYRLARNEVEEEVESARAQGQMPVPQHVVDDTIARNQRQISATLVDLLAALQRALKAASSLCRAQFMLDGCAFWDVFVMYEPSARRLNRVLEEALSAVQTSIQVEDAFLPTAESQSNSEESQDYGDSSALREFASSEPAAETKYVSSTTLLHEPVGQLVSNVFGADAAPDDCLLTRVVDTWIQLAQRKVRSGESSWTHYLNDYTSAAWGQLRDTEQRRKFTPYFLSKIVDVGSLDLNEAGILTRWLESLVEREAMLKNQHNLTSTLLNRHSDEPLLRNLPFSRPTNGVFDISLHELRERRLALLSSILSNMRDTLDKAMRETPSKSQALRKDYASLLKSLMTAMKSRYQDFDYLNKGDMADDRAQGAYVDFVQRVVSFMQQYTTHILQVDSFFTGSKVFPLPASDPTYMVGKLKSYEPKLSEISARKQLASFIKTVSERAAADGQQDYLVEQLVAAMSGTLEQGETSAPSLRHVLMTTIFPVYIENALSSACSWTLAEPILEACSRCSRELLYYARYEDEQSCRSVVEMNTSLLRSMMKPIAHALTDPGLMALPHIQAALTSIFTAARQTLAVSQHVIRIRRFSCGLDEILIQFAKYASSIEDTVFDPSTNLLAAVQSFREGFEAIFNSRESKENGQRCGLGDLVV